MAMSIHLPAYFFNIVCKGPPTPQLSGDRPDQNLISGEEVLLEKLLTDSRYWTSSNDFSSECKPKLLKLFGLGNPLCPQIIEDPKELLCLWVISLSIYCIRNEKWDIEK